YYSGQFGDHIMLFAADMDQLNLTSANFTNFSTSLHPPPSFSMGFRAVAPAVLLSLCFLVGFPGNLAVIILKPNWQNLSRLTQSLMMNLALSDLLCLITLPLWIYTLLSSWTLGTITCKIMAYVVYCSLYSSLLTVTALSVQRYIQVVHQQRCLQFKKRLLVLLWLTAMLFSIPSLVLY
uniref:G-protein coupled receptors family 1 profile domain-containing protein n=1 Tax=Neogobius melanostomus TaxID=47308 RepID=A0A8C6SWX8_9GOBI